MDVAFPSMQISYLEPTAPSGGLPKYCHFYWPVCFGFAYYFPILWILDWPGYMPILARLFLHHLPQPLIPPILVDHWANEHLWAAAAYILIWHLVECPPTTRPPTGALLSMDINVLLWSSYCFQSLITHKHCGVSSTRDSFTYGDNEDWIFAVH